MNSEFVIYKFPLANIEMYNIEEYEMNGCVCVDWVDVIQQILYFLFSPSLRIIEYKSRFFGFSDCGLQALAYRTHR